MYLLSQYDSYITIPRCVDPFFFASKLKELTSAKQEIKIFYEDEKKYNKKRICLLMANPQAGTGVPETIAISNVFFFPRRIVNSAYSIGATIGPPAKRYGWRDDSGPLLDVYWDTVPAMLIILNLYSNGQIIEKKTLILFNS